MFSTLLIPTGCFFSILVWEFAAKQTFSNITKKQNLRSYWLRASRNIGIGLVYRLLVVITVIGPLTHYVMQKYTVPLPAFQNNLLNFVVALLAIDFTSYATHYLAHRSKFLWRFHCVHHLDNELDASTGFRQHFAEKILIWPIKIFVILIFSIKTETLVLIEIISFCNGLFHHSKIRFSPKAEILLAKIFTIPAFHAVHHCNKAHLFNSNYGFIFTFWDRVFRTISSESISQIERPVFGVGQCKDSSFIKLITKPFYSKLPY